MGNLWEKLPSIPCRQMRKRSGLAIVDRSKTDSLNFALSIIRLSLDVDLGI